MDDMREWRLRNRPMLTVLAIGVGVGLFVVGLTLDFQWAIVRALVGAKVGTAGLWTGALIAAVGAMLVSVAALFPPKGTLQEPMKGEW
jgi:hypothetical protein